MCAGQRSFSEVFFYHHLSLQDFQSFASVHVDYGSAKGEAKLQQCVVRHTLSSKFHRRVHCQMPMKQWFRNLNILQCQVLETLVRTSTVQIDNRFRTMMRRKWKPLLAWLLLSARACLILHEKMNILPNSSRKRLNTGPGT